MVKPAAELSFERLSIRPINLGIETPFVGYPVEIDDCTNTVGKDLSKLIHHPSTLAVTQNGDRIFSLKRFDDVCGIANISFPGVQRSYVAVAVTPLIPRNNPKPRIRQQWCEEIPRACKVEAAMSERYRLIFFSTPLNNRNLNTTNINTSRTFRSFRPGKARTNGVYFATCHRNIDP